MSDHDTGFVDNGAARRTLRRLKLRRQQQELLCDIIEARRKLVERERARRKAEAAKRERVFAALSRLSLDPAEKADPPVRECQPERAIRAEDLPPYATLNRADRRAHQRLFGAPRHEAAQREEAQPCSHKPEQGSPEQYLLPSRILSTVVGAGMLIAIGAIVYRRGGAQ